MASALLILAKGYEEIEAVSTIDIMRRGGIEVDIAYLPDEIENKFVVGANGIVVEADLSLAVAVVDDYDIVVLPGGTEGTNRIAQNNLAQSLIKEFKERGKWIAAVCAAPYALYVAGVLSKKYTCYPGVENQIKNLDRVDEMVVVDDKVITSQGPATSICFGLEIVKHLVGQESYLQVKNGTLASYCSID